VGYFTRHDAADIAWHTRHAVAPRAAASEPIVRARRSPRGRRPAGAGLYARPARPLRPHLRLLRPAAASASWTRASTPRATATRWTPSRWSTPAPAPSTTARLISMVENGTGRAIAQSRARRVPEPRPACRAGSRASRSRRASPCGPDEKAQRWLLNISASDRARPALQRRARAGPAPASTCNWPKWPPWASGWTTPS